MSQRDPLHRHTERGLHDSPRWCDCCKAYGDHHTDRCPRQDTSWRHASPFSEVGPHGEDFYDGEDGWGPSDA